MQGRPLVLVLVLVLVLALALVLVLAQRCPGETYGGRHRRAATKSGPMLCGRWIGSHHVTARHEAGAQLLARVLVLVLVLVRRCPGRTYDGRRSRAAAQAGQKRRGRWIGSHHVMARAAMCAHLVVVRHEPTARVEARAQRVTSLTACHGTATFQHL